MFADFHSTMVTKVIPLHEGGKTLWKAVTQWYPLGDFILDDTDKGKDTATSLREQGNRVSRTIAATIEHQSEQFWAKYGNETKK